LTIKFGQNKKSAAYSIVKELFIYLFLKDRKTFSV
jgi:hypothetical protein